MAGFDFQTAVIDRSFEVPVLVDFWAPWCGPCRILGPVIEELADEAEGKWELIKVNTQDEEELARQYDIKSIPNVKLFHRGEMIGEFLGSLPKFQIQQWLENHLPNATRIEFSDIVESLEEDSSAVNQLEDFVSRNPNYSDAALLLARYKIFGEPERAVQILEPIKIGNPLFDYAEDIRLLVQLATYDSDESDGVAFKLKTSREAMLAGDWDATLNYLVEGLMIDKTFQNDFPRRVSIAAFRFLGEHHELTKKYRPRFSMALY